MYLNEADGFSTIAPLLFYIDGSTMDGIPNTHSNISAYTSSLVKTVCL